ncbi:uncharacterized protein METZ01_LOCUS32737 [marine metagenome]|uniref:ABC transporter ATP-binding protein n=1 Tax=marine metagenome TaxID=408172 RepID=A0A381QQP6_9ZZZZ
MKLNWDYPKSISPVPRIVPLMTPHGAFLVLASVSAFLFAVLDAWVYVLLIPFVETLFSSSGGPGFASATGMDRLLEATVYQWVDIAGDPLVAIGRIIILIILVFLIKNIFHFSRTYFVARVEQGVNRDLRNQIYGHLISLDLSFFNRTRLGQVVSRLTTEVEQFRRLVTTELFKVLSASLEFSVAVIAMVLISWQLTAAAFVVVPLAMIFWGPLVGVLRKLDHSVLDLGGDITAHIQETFSGIRLVKSSSSEKRERERFSGLTGEYFRRFMRAEFVRALAPPLTELLAAAGTVVILWFGARLVVAGEVTGPEFVGFLGLSVKLYSPVKNVAKFPAIAQPGLVAAERIFDFLDIPHEVSDVSGACSIREVKSTISFEDVSFSYRRGEPVLRGISFQASRGDVIALVGPSGAGKSTLVDLLGRFFDVDAGCIMLDGLDIRQLRIEDLRSLFAIVSQDTVLFHDTVSSNIAYGRPGASHSDIVAAATAAYAHEFITEMPRGYDTIVGERGMELSGGERQRVAIARALLMNRPILVLDEAMSSVDPAAERAIQEATSHLMVGRTVFVIAHRLSTILNANKILVMDKGEIIEQGDHGTLITKAGLYRRLYDLQFNEADLVGSRWSADEI